MEDEFQFLLCQRCQRESRNPKLLPCLHTLCMDCVQENKPVGQCPICQTPIPQLSGIPEQDNLLFANLQAKLNTYRKIVSGSELFCDCCRDSAEFWCSECEDFFCIRCFETHQWVSKKKSHETRKVAEVKAESFKQFLDGARKSRVLFCANLNHRDQSSSTSNIYCTGCHKPLCCACALLDSQHTQLYCNIEMEITRRQQELGSLSEELVKKKAHFHVAYNSLRDKTEHMDQVKNETKELIQKKVEQMMQLIREQEQELLEMVERQHRLGNEELEGKLQQAEAMLKRMGAGEQLVEKMHLYASDQEVMDMHLFIKKSLEEFKNLQPLAVEASVQAGDFNECKASLQALFERVTGKRDAFSRAVPATPMMEESLAKDSTPSGKRKPGKSEKAIQTPTKVLKLEPRSVALERTPRRCEQGLPDDDPQPGPSTSTPSRNGGQMPAARGAMLSGELGNTHFEPGDQEDSSIMISSSEDTDEDTADVFVNDATIIHATVHSQSQKTTISD
uniref:Protein PML n=1 Tax=Pelusios castaneus TaxID=367368 RepID=A0A8C8RLG8_9SAUR